MVEGLTLPLSPSIVLGGKGVVVYLVRNMPIVTG